METLREKTETQVSNFELEAQKHNAMISERYNRLKNAVDSQFAEETRTEDRAADNVNANVSARENTPLYISPNPVNTATYAQTPTVTEYVSPVASTIFTAERLNKVQSMEEVAPTATPVQATAVQMETQYALSPMAKIVMAVFTFVIVAMLTLITVNTNILNQKRIKIQNLEEKQEQLMEEYEEVKRRIEAATSEETIREYAESQGMVRAEN